MKRLILMGGAPWQADDDGKSLVDALLRYSPIEAKLAFCNFAQPERDWKRTLQANTVMFERFADKRALSYKIMTLDNFDEVSKWADIIYIPGGNPHNLYKKITTLGNVGKLWDDKTVAGSSAGADILCTQYLYLQDKTFGRGLGWVHATCIPHWQSGFSGYTKADWDFAEGESLMQFPNLPALCIPETKFVELTVV